ncbi:hypothetical protein CcaverHIS002_0303570 [Cutaneotrichosporon cavernicola]|uniref:WDR5-like beta-propeller domain-containing protein n=1 Tax=Cutaneotrichosporon cavernicola TaxID=279322 RepID=A0AA48IF84_9TREE|nr:uncharacterized protein CcaverHIS019_0303560 [Cutaneotrichosporon cavernicola]BEI82489.1 hypothetical protein CcaverHIS002_0303570 [Cutaneotrichosporon cavernicola]BEI90286.1 hypothetical protein CcaverHIS019_0303560 [Cutaneotrichosporon cavernicola]BEI98062.1 hypothetical protein CcaverHIS631_0303610 [Cutaneotrichosporon cavernicola]BEJ05839.1 hypothetical protein CcaverHIS641_0303610 [Cutaneotrichosporon cavernicola]
MAIKLNAEAGPSYTPAATLGAHTRSVTALRFSADGKTLVSAGADGYVHLWDAKSGVHQRALRCHHTGINDISLSPDGLYFCTASDDNTALVFASDPLVDAVTGDDRVHTHAVPLRTLSGHTATVLCVAYGPRSNLLVTGSYDESAIVWDVRRGRALRTLPAHADAIWSVGWDAEGALVITGSADGLIRLWDVNTGQCLKTLDNESNSPVSSASLTPSSFHILTACLSSAIRVYSLHTGKVLKTLRAPEYVCERFPSPVIVFGAERKENDAMDVDSAVPSAAPSPGRTKGPAALVVAGSENGSVVLWDMQERRVVAVLNGHTSAVVALAVSPDGTIASGSLEPERSIRLWRIE